MTSKIALLIRHKNKTYPIPITVGGRTYESLGFPELKQHPKSQTPQEFWETILYDIKTAWMMWIPKKAEVSKGEIINLPNYFARYNEKTKEWELKRETAKIMIEEGEAIDIPLKNPESWGRGSIVLYFKGKDYKDKWGMPFLDFSWRKIDKIARAGMELYETTYTLQETIEREKDRWKESTMKGLSEDFKDLEESEQIKKGKKEEKMTPQELLKEVSPPSNEKVIGNLPNQSLLSLCQKYTKDELRIATKKLRNIFPSNFEAKKDIALYLLNFSDQDIKKTTKNEQNYSITLSEGYYDLSYLKSKLHMFKNLFLNVEEFKDKGENMTWEEYAKENRKYASELNRFLQILLKCDSQKIKNILEIEKIMTYKFKINNTYTKLFYKGLEDDTQRINNLILNANRIAQLIRGNQLLDAQILLEEMYSLYFTRLGEEYNIDLESYFKTSERLSIRKELEKGEQITCAYCDEGITDFYEEYYNQPYHPKCIKKIIAKQNKKKALSLNEGGFLMFDWEKLNKLDLEDLEREQKRELFNILDSLTERKPIAQLWDKLTLEQKKTLTEKFLPDINVSEEKADDWFKLNLKAKIKLRKEHIVDDIMDWYKKKIAENED
jgi:ribosomal protein L22